MPCFAVACKRIDEAIHACGYEIAAFARITDCPEATPAVVSIMVAAKQGGFDNVKP